MTTFRCSLLLAAFALTACDGAPPEPPPKLTPEQQATRAQLCMGEIQVWRERGVWIHGGVEPAVNRDNWSVLGDDDRQQIADVAACIASAGAFEPRKVQIVSEGFKVPIEQIDSQNRLFFDRFRRATS